MLIAFGMVPGYIYMQVVDFSTFPIYRMRQGRACAFETIWVGSERVGTTATSHHDGSCHLERHQCLRDGRVVAFEV